MFGAGLKKRAFPRCLVGGVLLLGAVAAFGAKDNSGSEDWPASESIDPRGRPEGQIHNQSSRFYVFCVKDQWHVSITTKRGKSKPYFDGEIVVDQGKIKAVVSVGLEKSDTVQLVPDHTAIKFHFRSGRKADGFYFTVNPEVKRIKFDLKPPTDKPRRHIYIGKQKTNPRHCPFVLEAGE